MKNTYEIQLEKLCKKYNLWYENFSDSFQIHSVIINLLKTRCAGKKVALWGAGRKNEENSHAAIILKKYTTYIQGMVCLVDSMPELWGSEFLGYPIIPPKDIQKYNIDVMIISSKVQADSIISDLKKHAPNCEYIDIYGELRKTGFKVYHNFFDESNIYTVLYQLKKKYEEEKNSESLRNLISAYLAIQDFYYAEIYGEEFCKKKYNGYKKIEKFFVEFKKMQIEIKEKNSLKKEDIIIFFIDSMRAIDVFHKTPDGTFEADMLKPFLDKSVVFTNAKSTGVTTYESMVSVIKQKYPFEQNVYEGSILADFDEFRLLPLVKERDYKINFYVCEEYQVIHDHSDVKFEKQIYLPAKLWKLATDMAVTNNKTFNFVFFPYELHFPLLCGYHKQEPKISGFVDVGIKDTHDFVPRQFEECKHYVDVLMNYYETWFSKDILMTLFSDHSQVIFDEKEKKPYFMYYANQDRCVNITFFIKGYGLKQQWNTSLVSLYDFCSIIERLILEHKLQIPENKIVRYQYYKIHYKKLREYANAHGMERYINGLQCYTSKEYLYVLTSYGDKEVYRLGEKTELVTGDEAQNFIQQVEAEYDNEFPAFITD